MLTKAEIRFIKGLGDRRERLESGLFVAEGAKLAEEIARSELTIEKIFATGRADLTGLPAEKVFPVSGKEMERISQLKTPSDLLAVIRIPKYGLDYNALKNKLTLALDRVQDPGNLGTIIRMAEWFGVENILCSADTADCYNPKVVQATMGGITKVRLHYGDLPDMLAEADRSGIPLYGTFLEGEDVYQAELSGQAVIVMGSEGKGISAGTADRIGRKIRIPSFQEGTPGTDSLNVAVAASVICSEFRRRIR